MYKELFQTSQALIMLIVAAAIGLIIAGFLYVGVAPAWNEMHRQTIHSSNEYVQTKQALLLQLKTNYDQLHSDIVQLQNDPANAPTVAAKHAQQRSIIARMRTEAAMLAPRDVPPSVAVFLTSGDT